jgi:hypothetical protein
VLALISPGSQLQGDDGNDAPICGAVPASIAQYLRPYQREGVQFLWRCGARCMHCMRQHLEVAASQERLTTGASAEALTC